MKVRAAMFVIGLALTLLPTIAAAEDGSSWPKSGRYSFRELGWSSDRVVTADSGAAIEVSLPPGTSQGDPLWYSVTVEMEWIGGLGATGDRAYLVGTWNGYPFYQLKIKSVNPVGEGFEWSMVDLVNGESRGHELTNSFTARSTNFVPYAALHSSNQISFRLDLEDAGTRDVKVVISDSSEIVVTRTQPAYLAGHASASLRSERSLVVDVEALNMGLRAPYLKIDVIVSPARGSRTVQRHQLGAVASGEKVQWTAVVDDVPSGLQSVDVALDWGTGSVMLHAWPEQGTNPSLIDRLPVPPISLWLGIFAFVVAWVTIPEALRAARRD